MIFFIFYGVEYSCFIYLLGVYEIICRMIDDVFDGRLNWNVEDRLLCLCVVLFYDVGYGLFFYLFEKVFLLDYEKFM